MATLLNLTKKLFRQTGPQIQAYKYYHFLNSLPRERLEQILLLSESLSLPQLVPSLAEKRTLFFNDLKHKLLLKKILAVDPGYFLSYIHAGFDLVSAPTETKYYNIVGGLSPLALKKGFFDVAICPFVLQADGVDAPLIKAVAAVLKNGGRLILSVRHMQLEHMLYNQNPSQTAILDNSISSYYKILKENHLFIEDIEEGCVDKNLKPLFNQGGGVDHYHDYKKTPLTLMVRAVKFIKQGR